MSAYLLDVGATVLCQHGGTAKPTTPVPRVKLSGQPAVAQSSIYTVTGCPLVPPPLPPCVTAQWITAAIRVKSGGQPLLLQNSQAVCTPTGTGVSVVIQQIRVKGT